jgi:hypothetical protein
VVGLFAIAFLLVWREAVGLSAAALPLVLPEVVGFLAIAVPPLVDLFDQTSRDVVLSPFARRARWRWHSGAWEYVAHDRDLDDRNLDDRDLDYHTRLRVECTHKVYVESSALTCFIGDTTSPLGSARREATMGILKIALLVGGILAVLIGLIWVGQGTGYFPYPARSFMINQMPWVYWGAILAVLGLVAVMVSWRM